VHHQIAQKGPEILQVGACFGPDPGIVGLIVVGVKALAGSDRVVYAIQPRSHGDDHCGHGQRIQESRQEGAREREQH